MNRDLLAAILLALISALVLLTWLLPPPRWPGCAGKGPAEALFVGCRS